MELQQNIKNIIALCEADIIPFSVMKNGINKAVEKFVNGQPHAVTIDFDHEINDYGFVVREISNGVVVDAYKDNEFVFARTITDNTHENRIFNYCKKFANDWYYRMKRMDGVLN